LLVCVQQGRGETEYDTARPPCATRRPGMVVIQRIVYETKAFVSI
jgi:hypothetical protein